MKSIVLSPRFIEILEIYYTLFFLGGVGFILASRRNRKMRALWQRLLLIFSASLIFHAILTMGTLDFITLLGVGMLITVVTEWLAMKYDIWGSYEYSRTFTPILPGGMPLPVVIAWGVLLLISYWVALTIYNFTLLSLGAEIPAESSMLLRFKMSLLASIVAVSGDLVMDPVMAKHGHWSWKKSGKWYGVPFSNFMGWFITCEVTFMAIFTLIDPLKPIREPFFESGVLWLFVGIYLAVLADITLDAVKMRLSGPAVLGFLTIITVGTMLSILILT